MITAGHCLIHSGKERNPNEWTYTPAVSGSGERPYGSTQSVAVRFPEELRGRVPAPQADFGLVVLSEPIGDKTGTLFFGTSDQSTACINFAGYAGSDTMIFHPCTYWAAIVRNFFVSGVALCAQGIGRLTRRTAVALLAVHGVYMTLSFLVACFVNAQCTCVLIG